MAPQGPLQMVGTIDGLCFYQRHGKFFIRMKSSLTSKTFWKSKAFEGSRRSCKRFALGNQLASMVYKSLHSKNRVYQNFLRLKSKAIALIREGKDREEVLKELRKLFDR